MPKKTDKADWESDLKAWTRWNQFVDALNQPERRWLAELEARVDTLEEDIDAGYAEEKWLGAADDDVRDAESRLLEATAEATLDCLRCEMALQAKFATFWGRLKWLVRG